MTVYDLRFRTSISCMQSYLSVRPPVYPYFPSTYVEDNNATRRDSRRRIINNDQAIFVMHDSYVL